MAKNTRCANNESCKKRSKLVNVRYKSAEQACGALLTLSYSVAATSKNFTYYNCSVCHGYHLTTLVKVVEK